MEDMVTIKYVSFVCFVFDLFATEGSVLDATVLGGECARCSSARRGVNVQQLVLF